MYGVSNTQFNALADLNVAGRAELARSESDYAALVNRAMSAFTRSEVAAMTRLMVKLHDSIDGLEE